MLNLQWLDNRSFAESSKFEKELCIEPVFRGT